MRNVLGFTASMNDACDESPATSGGREHFSPRGAAVVGLYNVAAWLGMTQSRAKHSGRISAGGSAKTAGRAKEGE